MYDRLLDVDPATGELVPMLATGWSWNDDGTVLTLDLREGVTFHDGEPFDATAVVANVDRLLEMTDAPAHQLVPTLEAAEAIDDFVVELQVSEPDSSLLFSIASQPGAQISPAALASGVDLGTTAVGTGPYKLVEFKPNDRVSVERFADYWDPDSARFDAIEFIGMSDDFARLNALRSGAVDAAFLSAPQFDEAKSLGFTIEEAPSAMYIQLNLNRARGALGDVRVRNAIDHALDRESLCETVYGGHCQVHQYPMAPGHGLAASDADELGHEYDPTKARDILEEAGYEPGEVSFTVLTPSGYDPYPALSQAIQAQLSEVGIEVTLRPVDPTQMAEIYTQRKEADALLGGGGLFDPVSNARTQFRSDGLWNPSGMEPEGVALDTLIDQAGRTADHEEYKRAVQEMAQAVVDNSINVPLLYHNQLWAMSDQVTGLRGNITFATPYFRNLAPSK